MSYPLDRKTKRKNLLPTAFLATFCVLGFFFHAEIFYGLSYVTGFVFRPILSVGNKAGEKLSGLSTYFASKNALTTEVGDLKFRLAWSDARMSNYETLLEENEQLKEVLGRRSEETSLVLAVILGKPSRSLYDTLLVDAGEKQGISVGNLVYAFGNVPVGRVDIVYNGFSKVVLFSSPGEKMEVAVGGKHLELVGRGGGNFEMLLPRDLVLAKGDEAVLPSLLSRTVAIVETIISDPRDSFQKVLLTSPINIQELKFVEIAK